MNSGLRAGASSSDGGGTTVFLSRLLRALGVVGLLCGLGVAIAAPAGASGMRGHGSWHGPYPPRMAREPSSTQCPPQRTVRCSSWVAQDHWRMCRSMTSRVTPTACTDAPPRRNRHSRAPSPHRTRERLLERRANRRVARADDHGPPVAGLASTATSSVCLAAGHR